MPLGEIAIERLEQRELVGRLDALGHHAHVHVVGELDDGVHDRAVVATVLRAVHELTVDHLEAVLGGFETESTIQLGGLDARAEQAKLDGERAFHVGRVGCVAVSAARWRCSST